MRNIGNEEKGLKRYLKNHISLNLETMVKFLITGTVAISLTACGGGGGGGSSSDNSVPPVTNPEMGKPEDSELPEIGVDKAWDLKEEVSSLSGEKFTELLNTGKLYEKDGKYYIVADEENKIAQEVVVDPEMGKPEDSELPEIGVDKAWDLKEEVSILSSEKFMELLESGKLYEKDGKYYIVFDEENKIAQEVVVDPEMGKPEDSELPEIGVETGGVISGEQDVVLDESKESEEENVVLYKISNATVVVDEEIVLAVKGDESAAIYAVDNVTSLDLDEDRTTVVENKGTIDVAGDKSVGMVSEGATTKVVNKGNINGVSEERDGKTTSVYGMAALENGLAENEGTINIAGSGIGMIIAKGAQGINAGKIEVASNWIEDKDNWEAVSGITTTGSGSLAINEGDIFVKNSGKGMEAKDNSTVINKGDIEVEGHYYYETDSEGNILREVNGSTAIRVENGSTGINEGNIKTIGASNNSMFGIGETTLINNGVIDSKSIVTYIDDSGFDTNGVFVEERGIGYSFEGVMDGRENSYVENNGTILGEGSILGVTARTGSEALNTGDILITGKVEKLEDGKPLFDNEGNHMVSSSTAMRARDNAIATNEGRISIVGGDARGMDARRGSVGINKGDIYLESSEYLGKNKWTDEDGKEQEEEVVRHTWLTGMNIRDKSEGINEGDITLKGAGAGIRAERESHAINKGDINLESVKYIEQESERYTWLSGMEARVDSKVENEKNIYILGAGTGLRTSENSVAINKGDIHGESLKYLQNNIYEDSNGNIVEKKEEVETYIVGLDAYNNSRVENEGKIVIVGSGSGVKVSSNSVGENSGFISVEGRSATGGEVDLGGKFINSEDGVIEVKNTKYYAAGIRSNSGGDFDSNVEETKIENHGKIRVENVSLEEEVDLYPGASVKGIEAQGMRYSLEEKLVKVNVLNTGLVHVVGDNGIGIYVREGNVVNSGEIILEGKNTTALKIDGEGKLVNTSALNATGTGISGNSYSYSSKESELIIENEGDITVTGDGEAVKSSHGNYYSTTNAARGIDSNGGDIYNSGNIVATGDGAYLEYEGDYGTTYISSSAAVGIYASSAEVVKNEGDIRVSGDSKSEWSEAKGIYASGKHSYDSSTEISTYEKVSVDNSGTITVDGDYAKGILLNDADLVNTGKIEVKGISSVGISLTNSYSSTLISKIENEGDITVTGDGAFVGYPGNSYLNPQNAAIGIKAVTADIYNSGKIEVTGDAKYNNDFYPEITFGVRGIKLENPFHGGEVYPENKKIENFGEIVLSGKGDIKGIEAIGADIYNEGDITINNEVLEGDFTRTTIGIDAASIKEFKNTGNIQISLKGEVKDGYQSLIGIRLDSSHPSYPTEVLSENSGDITLTGDASTGIETNIKMLNTGNITIAGDNSTGIKSGYGSTSDAKLENEGDIFIEGNNARGILGNTFRVNNSGDITLNGDNAIGIESSYDINNMGNIVINGNNSYGIISFGGSLELGGQIIMTGDNNTGLKLSNSNMGLSSGTGNIKLTGQNVTGVKYSGYSYINQLNTMIDIYGSGVGVELESGSLEFMGGISIYTPYVVDSTRSIGILLKNNTALNNSFGHISLSGRNMIGIKLEGSSNVINGENGYISVSGENALGIVSEIGEYTWETAEIKNDGSIIVNGNSGYDLETSEIVTGIRAFNYGYGKGLVTNNGKIEVESSNDGARGIDSFGNDVVNNGIINVKGNGTVGGFDTNGIRVQGYNGTFTATNNGTINVDGKGAWGMYAGGGGVAINSATGIINVSATAEGGMVASGGTAINHGVINIEAGNLNTDIVEVDKNGNEVVKSAMFATNGGTIENYGTISTDGNLVLGSTTGGNYVIGTNEDGSYGKISAKNVDIDGDVIVSANITKNGFKDEYTMQNVIDAEDITLGDEFKLVSNSLLYDAKGVTDRWGNLDATLSRNDKVLSDFTTGYLNYSAEIFGKYQNEESFKALSSDAKEVIKAIDTTSIESIGKSLNSLRATIYSNLGRQMLETTETFRSQDLVAIDNLEGNTYNFTFIGEYRDVDSRKGIDGYESKMTGFVGAMNFGDGTYGTIGYGHNKVDYTDNGDGKIETIHLGLNRFMNYSGLHLRVGLGGEYNFHENKRDIDILSRKAESDFDSYGVNASAEISKKFGEDIYLKPSLGLDLAYMKYDSFTEEKAKSANVNVESESYTSVTPKVGALLGGTFGGLDIYTSAQYSYELGDMEKDIQFSYEGFDGMDRLVGDDLECGTTSLKAGVNYKMNTLTVGGTIGKNFGRRDNSFMSLNLGYRF
ncbi:autotransporter domain-containing protein [Cetobacterium sp.]|uniref:autotransporter outer membrane beta-barrel domain-containing protein n=1 Tax=Cetobacterium sp. TaxID=2071632 RepID=UPI003F2A450D